MQPEDVKQKLRRAASYLQGGNTKYFSNPPLLKAIELLYALADAANPPEKVAKPCTKPLTQTSSPAKSS